MLLYTYRPAGANTEEEPMLLYTYRPAGAKERYGQEIGEVGKCKTKTNFAA